MVFSAEAVIHVEKNKREKEYEEIRKSTRSPFKGMEMWVIFLNAMIMGYRKKICTPLNGTRHDLFRASTLGSEGEWLIKSIAIVEKEDLNILLDEKEILKIAEEYANGGILLLYDKIFGGAPGDPLKRMDAEARKIYAKLTGEGLP
ncbi:MAG: hypothetical protein QMC77_08535 [Methanocellales archaeon]|nr:hypothetical protein [Methanocellales archaeon]